MKMSTHPPCLAEDHASPRHSGRDDMLQQALEQQGVAGWHCRCDMRLAARRPVWQKTKLVPNIVAEIWDLEPEAKASINKFC